MRPGRAKNMRNFTGTMLPDQGCGRAALKEYHFVLQAVTRKGRSDRGSRYGTQYRSSPVAVTHAAKLVVWWHRTAACLGLLSNATYGRRWRHSNMELGNPLR